MGGKLDGPEDLGELAEVQSALSVNTRARDAAQDVLMDPDIRDKTRAKRRVLDLEAERQRLQDERAVLVAQRAQGSAFEEFKSYLSEGMENDPAADAAAVDRVMDAWLELGLERQRALIRGSFVVSVVDGKGAERVRVEPR